MSNGFPQEFQHLLLFAALSGRSFTKTELGIKLRVSTIDNLAAETGLLDVVRRGSSRSFSANAETRRWAGDHLLSADLEGKNKAVLAILQLIRARTDGFLKARGIGFAEFLQRDEQLSPADAIRQAYQQVSGGKYETRVLLKDLRKLLSLSREKQDHALSELIRAGHADLYPEDDPMSRTEEDERAAMLIADRPRHIMYLHAEPRL
jgi:hypothetical protein